jgi:hypothetical protein
MSLFKICLNVVGAIVAGDQHPTYWLDDLSLGSAVNVFLLNFMGRVEEECGPGIAKN